MFALTDKISGYTNGFKKKILSYSVTPLRSGANFIPVFNLRCGFCNDGSSQCSFRSIIAPCGFQSKAWRAMSLFSFYGAWGRSFPIFSPETCTEIVLVQLVLNTWQCLCWVDFWGNLLATRPADRHEHGGLVLYLHPLPALETRVRWLVCDGKNIC